MTNGWNIAEAFETIAHRIPDAPALVHDGVVTTWRQFDRRADALAAALLERGCVEQDKVAQYLYNGPEYLETVFAAFKAGLAVVNTNYRYTADELTYLWDNGDVVAVVFHGAFAPQCEEVRRRLPRISTWLWVDDGTAPRPDWAIDYADVVATTIGPGRTVGPWGRSGDHLLLIYTGGTTGMPKGVMWRQDDLFRVLLQTAGKPTPPGQDLDGFAGTITKPGPLNLPAAPLMHGTGLFNAIATMLIGGGIVTTSARSFDAEHVLDTIERSRAKSVTIVGDAFAKPMVRALDAEPARWDLSSLRVVLSSGVMWSKEAKDGLRRHVPNVILVDSLGSSEALGVGAATTVGGDAAASATFTLGPATRVITDDGRDVRWGSDERGRVAVRGFTPVGYYKDPVKSAATFVEIDGERYAIPGDYATIEADGTVRLLGRGSQCINTGGEKVYPEEVEEVLKRHDDVADAAVVGVPDERFGESITALVEPERGHAIDSAALVAHVKAHLAGYKAPRRIITVDSVGRAPNGKLDYRALQARARSFDG